MSLVSIGTLLRVIALVVLVAGCQSTPTPAGESRTGGAAAGGFASSDAALSVTKSLPAPTFTDVSGGAYRLGPLDVVNVVVFQVPELSGDFQVGSDGNLGFPLVGNVRAAGRTAEEVQRDLTTKLKASYMQQPQVTVKVTGFNSQKVTVDGAVNKPGTFPVMSTDGTLMGYIAQAGGMPRTANKGNVAVFRKVDGKNMVARFDVNAIRSGKLGDPQIYGGDTIIVPDSAGRMAWQDFLSAVPLASFVATAGGL